MCSIKERMAQRRQVNSRPRNESTIDTKNTTPYVLWLRQNPDFLADPRNWPELLTDRSVLDDIVDDPVNFTPGDRAIAWHVLMSDPRFVRRLHHQMMVTAKREIDIQSGSAEELLKLGVGGVIFDAVTEALYLEKHPHTRIKGGARAAAIRSCFALNGAHVIIEYPNLAGKELRTRIYRYVADELQASVLEYDASLTVAERKELKRLRVRTKVTRTWAYKWDEVTETWQTDDDAVYTSAVLSEDDVTKASENSDAPQYESGDSHESTPELVSDDRPLASGKDEVGLSRKRAVAQRLFQELRPSVTDRQFRAAQRRANGEQLTDNERQALCELRRKLRPVKAEALRKLGLRPSKGRGERPHK